MGVCGVVVVVGVDIYLCIVDLVNSCDLWVVVAYSFFFFQAEDGIRDWSVTGVQTCALPIPPLLNFQNFEAALRGSRATQDDETWYADLRG